ncbi:MAG: hypothetical protein P4N59_20365 [Negativicutes bacterium]|nr:hypothetical protein [Negativicutes bacterium]
MEDMTAFPLTTAVAQFEAQKLQYKVTVTSPSRTSFALRQDSLYVIRQTLGSDGIYQLMAAAKMDKEV